MDEKEIKDLTERLEKEAEERRIKFPVVVSGIDWDIPLGIKSKSLFMKVEGGPGTFVALRSCRKEHGDKTYLGLLIGYVPTDAHAEIDPVTNRIKISLWGDNPAIFVFDLNEVVLGIESFWGPIEDEAHLKQITQADIENVWYIKALKQLSGKLSPKKDEQGEKGEKNEQDTKEKT